MNILGIGVSPWLSIHIPTLILTLFVVAVFSRIKR